MPLKYLFTATFSDGSTYQQTPDDVSIFEPEKRSAYFDVEKLAKEKQLVRFELTSCTIPAADSYTVDLTDGHFEVNGVPFRFHEEQLAGFKLIYFRNHTHTHRQSMGLPTELTHEIVFRIGWQTTIDGKNYQHVMQLD